MEKEQRNRLQKATQDARRLLEEEFAGQLLQTYDINVSAGRWNEDPGAHLQAEQRLIREKLLAWIEHRSAQINDEKEALLLALREMAFTALNRFVALKLMEARELVRPCVSGGLESEGFQEFTAVAQGLLADQEGAYQLYLETIFEDVSRELRALFNPRDPASLLWPKRTALLELLEILNRPELGELWGEDETLGWVYQYFNGDAERKKMREESSAPRNSRELAVRNQFFTPRYVVEFLTDNTLGRIWYEMRQGDTGLKNRCRYLVRRPNETWLQPGEEAPAEVVADEALSQEELLRQPVNIPYRQLKDPREIRMLDPACGSMHFGLYAFDLYLEIYAEAWDLAQGLDEQAEQGEAFAPFVAYASDFADKASFLREVPRLILLHNIHGIDIDPRATQIARLTLWLRAQRAWQEQKIEVAGRPAISRSNVVCAEPMPGERELLADFVDHQFPEAERGLVQQLLETIFDKMQLAGEAGSLLKIEEEIRDAIDQARREWQKLAIQQRDLFSALELADLGGVGTSLNTDLQNLTKDFWINIEERIYAALRDYSNQAENSGGFQRRLFAEDAAQGFAFIDICRKRYDMALMNPPFGETSATAKPYVDQRYILGRRDLYACFVELFVSRRVVQPGLIGIISSRQGFFLPSQEEWRRSIGNQITLCADLGHGVLDDALVETAAYIVNPDGGNSNREQLFFDLLGSSGKAVDLHGFIDNLFKKEVYLTQGKYFECLPGAQISYWSPPSVLSVFENYERLEPSLGVARNGMVSCDDFRFVRLIWETQPGDIGRDKTWCWFAKGGEYSPFFDPIHLSVKWNGDGRELVSFGESVGNAARARQSSTFYFRPGLTYPARTTSGFSPRVLPSGSIFSHMGMSIFCNDGVDPLCVLGILLSSVVKTMLEMFVGMGDAVESGSAARRYSTGIIADIPAPRLTKEDAAEIAEHVKSICGLLAAESQSDETSPYFDGRLKVVGSAGLVENYLRYLEKREDNELACLRLSSKVARLVRNSYGLDERACEFVDVISGLHPCELQSDDVDPDQLTSLIIAPIDKMVDIVSQIGGHSRNRSKKAYIISRRLELLCDAFQAPPEVIIHRRRNLGAYAKDELVAAVSELISVSLGRVFGRWMIPQGVVGVDSKETVDPFAQLPALPPGHLQSIHRMDLEVGIDNLSSQAQIALDGVLVDDPGNLTSIADLVGGVFDAAWSEFKDMHPLDIKVECCHILGIGDLQEWFRRPTNFFADHLRRYSRSRRQAPVYWQLSAGNGTYSAWLYYHRFTQDTLYRVLRDFVEPRIQQAEREQFELESQGALSGDSATRLQESQSLLQDLRLLKNELDLVAPLWNPNLNDGVIINHAILWRITPYTPWQKKCKECWDNLVKGDYDWAHLSFHLWPERVIRKCQSDRSLAIAHGLEERLWQENNKGHWLQRQLLEAELQALIAEHSKPAVQNALERFLAAPPPVAAARTRAPRAAKTSSAGSTRKPRGSAPAVDAEASRQTLLVLTAAPAEGLGRNAIADLLAVEAASLTAVIKQLKESGQIEQLGAARGAKYRLTEQGRVILEPEQDA